jgi:hypothetical protein
MAGHSRPHPPRPHRCPHPQLDVLPFHGERRHATFDVL